MTRAVEPTGDKDFSIGQQRGGVAETRRCQRAIGRDGHRLGWQVHSQH
jgi:hypothetical protein